MFNIIMLTIVSIIVSICTTIITIIIAVDTSPSLQCFPFIY